MPSKLDYIIGGFVDDTVQQAQRDIDKSIQKTNKILVEELKKMYRTYIQQFYSYETESYIRHGTSRPGLGYGYALYRAERITEGRGRYPTLNINISGDYIDEKYQHDTPDHVLDLVINNIRSPFDNSFMRWSGSYVGKYFGYDGSIAEAFNSFDDHFDRISKKVFNDVFEEYGWRS